ncbi:unnamed protein product [Heligmosomoides polygyrus]|uniref:MULE domain-containing protein n=1 Tax=Heligmosomoides polygyrus TaxID=6339 RepID=A0A183GXB4_HELPZ|nr:unnamed protein product [Heligmosomoides polygyrus]
MTADVHIYYSCTTIKKAYENGLFALVADGVHKILPTQLGDQAQLYTIHGVCSNGHEIPLLYALTRAQRESTYELVFSCLERELRSLGPQCVRRFVVDFERAAINAAKRTFPGINVEGCAFHLAQAWNRRRDALGLRKFIVGPDRCRRVAQWWRTIKGLPFLRWDLFRRNPALARPPVPRDHEAFQGCQQFLEYLHATWIRGPLKEMWCKWGITELRTTNLAEAYHRYFLTSKEDHPQLPPVLYI